MLRDSILYLGSYDQIHAKNFGSIFNEESPYICDVDDIDMEKGDLGRNYLNEGGPQIHSFPGLSQWQATKGVHIEQLPEGCIANILDTLI